MAPDFSLLLDDEAPFIANLKIVLTKTQKIAKSPSSNNTFRGLCLFQNFFYNFIYSLISVPRLAASFIHLFQFRKTFLEETRVIGGRASI